MDEIGTQYPQPDPRGWLVFESLPYELQLAEDSTQAADHERSGWNSGGFDRPATAAERTLLEHLGHTDLPEDLITHVSYRSESVRNRRWPLLDTPEV